MEYALQTKTLTLHFITNVSRVLFSIAGQAYWQKAFKGRHKIEAVDQNFVDDTEYSVKVAIIVLIAVGLIVDLVAWRRRHFANLIIYFESVSVLVQSFVPFDYGTFDLLVFLQTYILLYWIGVCKTGQSVVAPTVTYAIEAYVVIPKMYIIEGGHWSFGRQFALAQSISICFIFLTIMSMLITYIVRIRGKMGYLF